MSRLRPFVPRPADLHCCFWEILLLLAEEPAFEFLREALSVPLGWPCELSVAEAAEGGLETAASAGRAPQEEDFPQAEESPGRPDLPDDGEWATGGSSPHPVGQWSIQALRLLERSGHPRMWVAYNMGLYQFLFYRAAVRLPSLWPIPGPQCRGFVLSLDAERVSIDQILIYLSALSYLSLTFGFQDPLQDFYTAKMIVGLQWREDPPKPLSLETLELVLGELESVCNSFYECLMFQAAFLLAFHAVLRPKEIVARNADAFHPELLCLSDIEVKEDCVGLKLIAYEVGAARVQYWLASSEQPWLCPVVALKNFLAVRPPGEGPLFWYRDWRILCKRRFLEVFRGALRRLDLPAERYAMRSFYLGSLINAVRYLFPESIDLNVSRWPDSPLPGRPGGNGQP